MCASLRPCRTMSDAFWTNFGSMSALMAKMQSINRKDSAKLLEELRDLEEAQALLQKWLDEAEATLTEVNGTDPLAEESDLVSITEALTAQKTLGESHLAGWRDGKKRYETAIKDAS